MAWRMSHAKELENGKATAPACPVPVRPCLSQSAVPLPTPKQDVCSCRRREQSTRHASLPCPLSCVCAPALPYATVATTKILLCLSCPCHLSFHAMKNWGNNVGAVGRRRRPPTEMLFAQPGRWGEVVPCSMSFERRQCRPQQDAAGNQQRAKTSVKRARHACSAGIRHVEPPRRHATPSAQHTTTAAPSKSLRE